MTMPGEAEDVYARLGVERIVNAAGPATRLSGAPLRPEVAAATVVGMPDPYRGESPAAFVEARPGSALTADALRDFLKDKLSPVEMPRLIEIRDALPRTPVGKLSKKELRAELQERPGSVAPPQ